MCKKFYPFMMSENCDWIDQPSHNAPKTDILEGYFDVLMSMLHVVLN